MRVHLGVVVLIGILSMPAFAWQNPDYNLGEYNFDFAAPVVSGTSAIADKQVGMIVFDASSNQFKGLDSSGNWDAFSSSAGSAVVSGGTSERVERVALNSNCSADPCSGYTQSGSWVSAIHWNANGDYTINFTTGVFSSAPTCICTSTPGMCRYLAYPSTNSVEFGVYTTAGATTNQGFEIICMGPH